MPSLQPGTADRVRLMVEEEFGPGYWDGFQRYMTEDLPWHEWRFGGRLGSGGKVHFDGRRIRVGGYAEDMTDDLRTRAVRLNNALAELAPASRDQQEPTDG